MPEGDTVFQTARRQNAALAGLTLTGFDLRVPEFATSDLTGETVHEVVSVGKHLFHRIGEYSLHSHLKMEGSWRLFRPGERWTRPAHLARAVLDTATVTSVGFELGVTELIRTADEHTVVGHLGPDLLGPGWDAAPRPPVGSPRIRTSRSSSPCSTSATSRASATSTRTSCASCAGSIRPARWARSTTCRPSSTSRGGCCVANRDRTTRARRATCAGAVRPGSTGARASPAGAAERP